MGIFFTKKKYNTCFIRTHIITKFSNTVTVRRIRSRQLQVRVTLHTPTKVGTAVLYKKKYSVWKNGMEGGGVSLMVE